MPDDPQIAAAATPTFIRATPEEIKAMSDSDFTLYKQRRDGAAGAPPINAMAAAVATAVASELAKRAEIDKAERERASLPRDVSTLSAADLRSMSDAEFAAYQHAVGRGRSSNDPLAAPVASRFVAGTVTRTAPDASKIDPHSPTLSASDVRALSDTQFRDRMAAQRPNADPLAWKK